MRLNNIEEIKGTVPVFLPTGLSADIWLDEEGNIVIRYVDDSTEVLNQEEFDELIKDGIETFNEPSQKIMESFDVYKRGVLIEKGFNTKEDAIDFISWHLEKSFQVDDDINNYEIKESNLRESLIEKVEETKNYKRERQASPKSCKKGSFRTKEVNDKGDKIILCKDKETDKMKVQSVLKKKNEGVEGSKEILVDTDYGVKAILLINDPNEKYPCVIVDQDDEAIAWGDDKQEVIDEYIAYLKKENEYSDCIYDLLARSYSIQNEYIKNELHKYISEKDGTMEVSEAKQLSLESFEGDIKQFCVVKTGGSIGKEDYIVNCFDTKEEAQEAANRYRKRLSPGERKYYRIKYTVVDKDKPGKFANLFAQEIKEENIVESCKKQISIEERQKLSKEDQKKHIRNQWNPKKYDLKESNEVVDKPKRRKINIVNLLDWFVGPDVDISDYYVDGDNLIVEYSEDGETTEKMVISKDRMENELGVTDLKFKNDENGSLDRISFIRVVESLNEEEKQKAYRFYINGDDRPYDIMYAKDEKDMENKIHQRLDKYGELTIDKIEEVPEDHETVTLPYFMKSMFSDGPDAYGEVTFYPTPYGYDYETGDKDFDDFKNKPQWSTLRTIEAIKIWFRNVLFQYGGQEVRIGDEYWNKDDLKESLNEDKPIYDQEAEKFLREAAKQGGFRSINELANSYPSIQDIMDKTGVGADTETQQKAQQIIDRILNESLNEVNDEPEKFKYMLLDRLKQDCLYYIENNGSRSLWAKTVDDQIVNMKQLWNELKIKPEWLTMEKIEEFDKKMHDIESNKNESLNEGCKIAAANRLARIAKKCKNVENRQKAATLLDQMNLGVDVKEEVKKFFKEIDKEHKKDESMENGGNTMKSFYEELDTLLKEVNEEFTDTMIYPGEAQTTDVCDLDIPQPLANTISTDDNGEVLTMEKVVDKVEDMTNAIVDKLDTIANELNKPEPVVEPVEEVTLDDETIEDVADEVADEIEDKVEDEVIEDEKSEEDNDEDEKEEKLEESFNESAMTDKFDAVKKALIDLGVVNPQIDIIDNGVGGEMVEITYENHGDMFDDIVIRHLVSSFENDLEDVLKQDYEEVTDKVDEYKQYLRDSKYEDLNQTKQEIDKAKQQGKTAEEVKTIIDINSDDEKEKEEAEKYAVDKLTESLLATSKNCKLKDLKK